MPVPPCLERISIAAPKAGFAVIDEKPSDPPHSRPAPRPWRAQQGADVGHARGHRQRHRLPDLGPGVLHDGQRRAGRRRGAGGARRRRPDRGAGDRRPREVELRDAGWNAALVQRAIGDFHDLLLPVVDITEIRKRFPGNIDKWPMLNVGVLAMRASV